MEDGSDGISMESVVNDAAELEKRARFVQERWRPPAIAEEYIEGREVYVGVIGNQRLTALPARGIDFGEMVGTRPLVATAKVKHDAEYREKWKIKYGPAKLTETEWVRVAKISKKVFRILKMRHYGRVDLRVTEKGEVIFLEANPNPDIGRHEEVAEAAQEQGMNYTALIERIVTLAMNRYSS